MSDVFAAVVGITGGTTITDHDQPPDPDRAIPVLMILGLDDLLLPYCGGWGTLHHQWTYSAEEALAFWKNRNGCENSFVTALGGFEDA